MNTSRMGLGHLPVGIILPVIDMAVRKVILLGNPILRQKARPVRQITKVERQLIADLVETMEAHEGVGLAAPQVGILQRIFVARWEGETFALINPQLEWVSRETAVGMEGCLSIPGVQGKVVRHQKIRIRALDADGNPVVLQPEGWLARIFQHEMDHLNGILILDRAEELFWVREEETNEGEPQIRLISATKEEILSAFRRHRKPAATRAR